MFFEFLMAVVDIAALKDLHFSSIQMIDWERGFFSLHNFAIV